MSQILIVNAVLAFLYMTGWFFIGYVRKRLDAVDTAWGLGFVLLAWAAAIQQANMRSLLVAGLVSIWGVRLSAHIGARSRRNTHDDPRYVELSRKWRGNFWRRAYVSIFMVQGALVWIISLPVVMAGGVQLSGWEWLTAAGGLVWLVGFCFESVADRQLRMFLKDTEHPKVLRTGLWRYSRHPNYFGELLMWWGIGMIALQTSYGWVGLAGPLTLTVLILFVSGIPPIERRRAKDPAYREYQKRTSVLVPLPPRS
jgi:steroid 5-alpha reductase family enzyme